MSSIKKAFFYSVLIVLPFLIVEAFFRLLPVSNLPHPSRVSADTPFVHYPPNLDYVYSKGWNFAITARKHSNNYGYNNVIDYHPEESTPLLMVIGDSFVEALEVDAGKSSAEISNSRLGGAGRVYSIGFSGAPLSQYLAFAEFARNTFHPNAVAVFVVLNDFDESLLKYKSEPRFHYFEEAGDRLVLRRVDYEISPVKKILRRSALLRYIFYNLTVEYTLGNLSRFWRREDQRPLTAPTPSSEERLRDSKRGADTFLDELPSMAGVPRDSVVFVLDAMRPAIYSPEELAAAQNTYLAQMREYFMQQARTRGYEVVDLQAVFLDRYRTEHSKFEFPTDMHWNELGHRVVADELLKSRVFRQTFRR